MIRKMTKQESEAHMAAMFSRLPDAELEAFKVAIANEQARRQNAPQAKAQAMVGTKFMIVDPAILKIRQ